MKNGKIACIGINMSHNATACLIIDGEVVGCISEERFNRKKNYIGFPKKSVEYLLNSRNLKSEYVDLYVLSFLTPLFYQFYMGKEVELRGRLYHLIAKSLFLFPHLRAIYQPIHGFYTRLVKSKETKEMVNGIGKMVKARTIAVEHHVTHAYSPIFSLLEAGGSDKYLVFTNDGQGDNYCASVNIYDPTANNNPFRQIGGVTKNSDSLALLYLEITRFLGMKPIEDEYKVMGLAPYASSAEVNKTYSALKDLINFNEELQFKSKINAQSYPYYLKKTLGYNRFDGIAGATQKLVENLLSGWVRRGIKATGIKKVAFAGGVFMNVKANMEIVKLPEVEEVYFMPSAGDESTAIGAAYYGYHKICQEREIPFAPKPLKNLYLGPEYTKEEIRAAIKETGADKKYNITERKDIEKDVAKLLADGEVVARFKGKMEWGARALGNRSILAHPSNPEIVRTINEQIKCRDFWMPFAATILKERENDYILNPKNVDAKYMILAFESTELARKELKAAMHPYDYTIRPQILERDHNPEYYRCIKEFENLTGIGGVLNTSFNLHGEPMVCAPTDAIHTFENSGLEHLAIGNFLVSKPQLE